jgi:hypothetical protein
MTGSGTAIDPFVIWNVNDLQAMTLALSAWYELGADIDATITATWNGGLGFIPIGSAAPFKGHFNGNYHVITRLYSHRGTPCTSLFGEAWNAVIANVILVDVDIYQSSNGWVAGLVGFAQECQISRCAVTGKVYGDIPGHAYAVGMIAGIEKGGSISECFAVGTVQGFNMPAGLVGTSIAFTTIPTIANSYARVAVTGSVMAAGFTSNGGVITNCYSTGPSSAAGPVDGFSAASGGDGTKSFWDRESSGNPISGFGTGKTTAEMKTQSTFTDKGWDFVSIWNIDPLINDGYPFLRWSTPTITMVSPNGGENWTLGTTHQITWSYAKCPSLNVKLDLYKGGLLVTTIVASTPIGVLGLGSYTWNIPAILPPGDDYRARITDTLYPYTDNSNNNFRLSWPGGGIGGGAVGAAVVTLPATEVR